MCVLCMLVFVCVCVCVCVYVCMCERELERENETYLVADGYANSFSKFYEKKITFSGKLCCRLNNYSRDFNVSPLYFSFSPHRENNFFPI